MAIAADRHGAPTAAAGPRIIIEEEAAGRVGATANRGVGAFDEKFGGGTRDCRKKPFEAAFAGDEFQAPAFRVRHQFVMALGEAKQVVDGSNPAFGEGLLLHECREDGAERLSQA